MKASYCFKELLFKINVMSNKWYRILTLRTDYTAQRDALKKKKTTAENHTIENDKRTHKGQVQSRNTLFFAYLDIFLV